MADPALLLLWPAVVSAIALLFFGWDKGMAKAGRRRVPESALWLSALLGGGVGAWLGMTLFRHKTRKGFFPVGIPLLALLQLSLLGWALLRP